MNVYLKIAAAAIIASYVSPKIANRFVRAELNESDAIINSAIIIGSNAATAAAVYALAGYVIGGKATVAGGGGAS